MIELRHANVNGCPLTDTPAEVFDSFVPIIERFGLSLDEIENGLRSGAPVRGKYLIRFEPAFLKSMLHDHDFSDYRAWAIIDAILGAFREDTVNAIVSDYVYGLTREEIKTVLGISDAALRKILSRAYAKLKAAGSARRLAERLGDFTKYRDRRGLRDGTSIKEPLSKQLKRRALRDDLILVKKTTIKMTVEG